MNDIGCARGFDSAVKFAALAALSVQVESSLHQFEVPAARECPLVKTKHVTVSAHTMCAPGDQRPSFTNSGCVKNEPVRGVKQSTSTSTFVIEREKASSWGHLTIISR